MVNGSPEEAGWKRKPSIFEEIESAVRARIEAQEKRRAVAESVTFKFLSPCEYSKKLSYKTSH